MANTLGSHNPLRYRGYYYDRESGFYYLKSRYYDPNTGKFLNADSVTMLVSGEKAYTYCENNPVNFNDNDDGIKEETEKKYISYNRYSNFSKPKYYDNLRESLEDGEILKIYFLSER